VKKGLVLCLSRACLGKMIILTIKMARNEDHHKRGLEPLAYKPVVPVQQIIKHNLHHPLHPLRSELLNKV
jgi:hypothetical protein